MLQHFKAVCREMPAGTTPQCRALAANSALRKDFSAEELSAFHSAKRMLRATHRDLVQSGGPLGRFEASLAVLHSTDIALMLRYLECVNAQRNDSTLAPVAFLRGLSCTSEILAWRLLRASPK
jgi:hypothetical protein